MNINKELIMKHLLTICCAISVLLLLLPFATVTVEVKSSFVSASSEATASGFDAAFGDGSTIVAWLMLICPIVLVAMNYIKQLDKFKNILALVLPIVSIVSAIATLFLIGAPSASASAGGGSASAEMSTSPAIGFFLLIVAYVATFVAGAVTFFGLKLSKDGIAEFANKIKSDGLNVAVTNGEIVTEQETAKTVGEAKPTPVKAAKKTNISQANDVLEVIKQLSEMKNQGIITEEEFTEKKKELLSQI